MKKILYACRDIKYAVKGLEFLLSNKDIVLNGCLINQESDIIRDICRKNDIQIYDDENRYKIEKDFEDSELDLLISFSYPRKIEDFIINKAKQAINFHPAPLPEYKGKACCCHGIYNGETKWGGTFHILTSEFDGGAIIEQRFFKITPNLQYGILLSNAAWNLGYEMLVDLINEYVKTGIFSGVEQKERGNYYSKKDLDEARKIHETDSADVIEKKIKAFWFPPFEGAYIERDGIHFSVITKEILSKIDNI